MARLSDPEPVLWTLFGAGGMVNAFLVPAHLLVFGILVPLGLFAPSPLKLQAMVEHPLGKLYLLVLIPLPLFHFAHRFRFTLVEVGFKQLDTLISLVLYGSAIVLSVVTAVIVLGV